MNEVYAFESKLSRWPVGVGNPGTDYSFPISEIGE